MAGEQHSFVRKTGVLRVLRMPVLLWLGAGWLLLALICTQIPLLHSLGYEFALLFGVLAAWSGAPVLLHASRRLSRLRAASPLAGVVRDWRLLSGAALLLLLPPAGVMVVNAIFVRNCAPLEGALLYALIPGLTVLFSAALVLLVRALFPRRAWLALTGVLLALLLQPLLEILSRPQLFSYNHVFGMFVGLSWDQHQPPMATLALYRLLTLSMVLMMLAAAAALRSLRTEGKVSAAHRKTLALLFIPGLVLASALSMYGDELGFSNSMRNLQRRLPGTHSSAHFLLLYDTAAVEAEDIRLIAEEHEFRLHQVCSELGIPLPDRITSVLYPDRDTRGSLLGTYSSEVARPWKAEIHLSMDGWSESLKHELVHVAARAFGPNYIGVPFIRVLGLTEGLAMAVEWDYGDRSLHEYAAGMLHYGLLPPVRRFMSTLGFASGSSSVGYVAGGSFTRWLIDTYGMARMKKAYQADDIESVYGAGYAKLESGWHAYLRTLPRESSDSLTISYLFRRPSLFTAMCPRAVGERSRAASELLRGGRAGEALRMFGELERLAPSAASAFGVLQSQYQRGRMDSVRAFTVRMLNDSSRAFSLLPMLLWQGAAHWSFGDSTRADLSFSRLIDAGLPGWTSDRARRFRRLLRENARSKDIESFVRSSLLVSSNPDSVREAQARNALALLRKHVDSPAILDEAVIRTGSEKSLRDTAAALVEAIPMEQRSPVQWTTLGRHYYRLGKTASARVCFERAGAGDARLKKELDVWIERCDWRRAKSRERRAEREE